MRTRSSRFLKESSTDENSDLEDYSISVVKQKKSSLKKRHRSDFIALDNPKHLVSDDPTSHFLFKPHSISLLFLVLASCIYFVFKFSGDDRVFNMKM